jgi:hypothetical protein
MSFEADREELIRGVLDSGFLPPRADALSSVGNAVRLWLHGRREDARTVDGALLDVLATFNELASAIVPAVELPETDRSLMVPFAAAHHVVAVANALTFLGGGGGASSSRAGPLVDEPRTRWAEAIIDLCYREGASPWHTSPNSYVCVTGAELASSVASLRASSTISLDPDDPALAIMDLPSLGEFANDPDFAAKRIAWRAAAAICIAACLAPDFRLGIVPSQS